MIRSLWFRHLRRWFASRRVPAIRIRQPQFRTRPRLECLEERTLLSTYTVNALTDTGAGSGLTGDIRYAITQANNNPGSTITFSSSLSGQSINLTQGELQISASTTITGLGASQLTISGFDPISGNDFRVFDITSSQAMVTISGLTITDGNASPAVNFPGNQGGNIFNAGNLTLTKDIISNGLSFGFVGGPSGAAAASSTPAAPR